VREKWLLIGVLIDALSSQCRWAGSWSAGADTREVVTDAVRERGLLGRIEVEDPVLGHHGMKLLLLVGDARREWGDVPVHVSVTLLASETEQIYTFGRYCRGYRSRDTMHNGLQALRF
jgi:hypothetical protein